MVNTLYSPDGDQTYPGESSLFKCLVVTDKVAELLRQSGIDPTNINKINIPAGLSNVGSLTLFGYWDTQVVHNSIDSPGLADQIFLKFANLAWALSKHHRVHKVFPSFFAGEFGDVNNSLAVVTFYDWRYELNFGTGTTTPKSLTNSYNDNWNVYRPDDAGFSGDEDDGESPYEFLRLSGTEEPDLDLHLFCENNAGVPVIPSLGDPQNMWGYESGLSKGQLVDKILMSCGVVAIPIPPWIGNSFDTGGILDPADEPHDWALGETFDPQTDWMVARYIGDGHKQGFQTWEHYEDGSFINGQLAAANSRVQDFRDVLSGSEDDDTEMMGYLDEGVETQPDFPDTSTTGFFFEGLLGIPFSLTIQFPAKTSSGQIVIYKVLGVKHGFPYEMPQPIAPLFELTNYTDPVTITDHIKTNVTMPGSWITFDEDGEEITNTMSQTGITEVIIEADEGGVFNPETIPGLEPERAVYLFGRALKLSRCYYARFWACTGQYRLMGHQTLNPWSGQLNLEYGFKDGMPYTHASGDINDPLFGFGLNEFANSMVVSSGGVMLPRPDGITDLATAGGGVITADVLVEITEVTLSGGSCFPLYNIRRFSDGKTWSYLIPTSREIPNMCYSPAQVGSICLFAVHPNAEDPEEPVCGQGVCEYVFIVPEDVKTIECQ